MATPRVDDQEIDPPSVTGLGVTSAQIQALDQLFQPANRSDSPGLVVGISLGDHSIYRRGFGLASVQHGIANTPSTRMRIASISKHFTSLACLLLVEDGMLDIDAPANTYLPELPMLQGMPSLRDFMAHTSGYRCTLELGSLGNGLALQPKDWQLKALARQTGVNFAPKRGQMYCNGTYYALSLVIERITGIAFEQFLRTRIFEPLSMYDTESVPDDATMVPSLASLHIPALKGGWQRAPSESELRGDGGIVSSADDMLRWLAHLRGSKIVGNPETWSQLLTPITLANGHRSVYSLGLKCHSYRGVEVIQHSGGLFGLNAQMLSAPEYELDLIIMINGAPLSATELSKNVVDTVLGESRLGPRRGHALSSDFRHLLGSRYRGKDGLMIGFADVNSKLAISLVNLHPAPVLFDEGAAIRAGFEDIGVGPYVLQKAELAAAPEGEAPEFLRMEVSGQIERMERLPGAPLNMAEIARVLKGRYRSRDLAADAKITCEDGISLHIRGDYSAWRSLTLQAYSSTEFGVAEQPQAGGRYMLTAELKDDQAIGFWIDAFHARRVRFDRIADCGATQLPLGWEVE